MTSILVTDDDEMIRAITVSRLEREGYEVSIAEDGVQALAQLAKQPFDLILLDVMMPNMNGLEVLEHLQKHNEWKDIPVIMLTAVGDKSQVVKCLQLGADNYLVKPFQIHDLKIRIREVLAKSSKQ